MNNNDANSYIELGFFTLAEKYLHTSGKILEQMINYGNPFMTFYDGIYNDKDFGKIQKEHDENTRWSDFNVLIPTLFLFYHGLELILKGLVLLNDKQNSENLANHDIENLFEKVKIKYDNKNTLINILEKYIIYKKHPEVLKKYIQDNKLNNAKELYFSLRYPFDKKLNSITNYLPLKYKEDKITTFAKELIDDINVLCQEAVLIYRASN